MIETQRDVDLNPERATLVGRAADYRWSSATTHRESRDPSRLLDLLAWSKIRRSGDWSSQLTWRNDEELWAERLVEETRHDRPWGDENCVHHISELARRVLMHGVHDCSSRNGSSATAAAGTLSPRDKARLFRFRDQ